MAPGGGYLGRPVGVLSATKWFCHMATVGKGIQRHAIFAPLLKYTPWAWNTSLARNMVHQSLCWFYQLVWECLSLFQLSVWYLVLLNCVYHFATKSISCGKGMTPFTCSLRRVHELSLCIGWRIRPTGHGILIPISENGLTLFLFYMHKVLSIQHLPVLIISLLDSRSMEWGNILKMLPSWRRNCLLEGITGHLLHRQTAQIIKWSISRKIKEAQRLRQLRAF
jgi:hypothetical protein